MPETDLVSAGSTRHFLIEPFDRIVRNKRLDKLHYVSWAGLAHADRDAINSYEQLILLLRKMKIGQEAETQLFRRAVFNIIGRNHDEHTKNTDFPMDRRGTWKLSPAFDITYSYDPFDRFTINHQCRLNSKDNDFEYDDLIKFGRYCNLSENRAGKIIKQIGNVFSEFPGLASDYDLSEPLKLTVEKNLRLRLLLKKV